MPAITVDSLKNAHGFTKDQLKEYKTQFDAFDEDGGGSIETNELKNVLERCGLVVTDEQVADMIKEFDEDNSGSLDFQEFITMMHRLTSGPTEKEIRKTMFEVSIINIYDPIQIIIIIIDNL
jgi:calmodulin